MEKLMKHIQEGDATRVVDARTTQDTQDTEIATILGPAKDKMDKYIKECEVLLFGYERGRTELREESAPSTPAVRCVDRIIWWICPSGNGETQVSSVWGQDF